MLLHRIPIQLHLLNPLLKPHIPLACDRQLTFQPPLPLLHAIHPLHELLYLTHQLFALNPQQLFVFGEGFFVEEEFAVLGFEQRDLGEQGEVGRGERFEGVA